MSRMRCNYSVDADVVKALRPLAKKYGLNMSDVVSNALFAVLQQLRGLESLSEQHPDGVPPEVARTYMNQLVAKSSGDLQSIADELYPAPLSVSVSQKAKA